MNHSSMKFTAAAMAGVASVLAAGSQSRAAVTISTQRVSNVTFSNGTYDVVNFYVTGLTGADATTGGSGQDAELLGLSGTFSAVGTSAALSVPGVTTPTSSAIYYEKLAIEANAPQVQGTGTVGSSYVDFPNFTGPFVTVGATGQAGTTRSNAKGTATSFNDGWYVVPATAAGPAGGIEPGQDPNGIIGADANVNQTGLLASILVSSGQNVAFTGQYSDYGFTAGNTITFTSAAGAATSPLISLTTTAPTGFGSQLGTLALTGKGSGSYNAAKLTFAATNAGYVAVTGFTPASDQEVYGLRVLEGGAVPSAADLATIVADINAAGGNTDTNGTVTAAVVSPAFAGEFAGDDIMLTTSSTTSGSPFLGFNFATATGITGALTVTSITAVPEPATLATLAFASVGLLAGRRRRSRGL